MPLPTEHLPAERAEPEEVLRQSGLLSRSELIPLTEASPLMQVVVNGWRQIVYANRPYLDFAGLSLEGACGLRPGESLGCLHAQESDGGCGTSRFCRYCGAAKAIVASLGHRSDTQECRISRGPRHRFKSLNLQVWASPFPFQGEQFGMLCLLDIYQEKRLKMMERLFYHDVLNSASGVCSLAEILAGRCTGELRDLAGAIQAASSRLVDQIMAQRDFSQAEDGVLSVTPRPLTTGWMMGQAANLFSRQAALGMPGLEVDRASPDLSFASDPNLLFRVLVNLCKNALEACGEGETARLSASEDGDGVVFSVRNPAAMNEETQTQVFKRMFSTKGSGRGMGTYGARLFTERYLGGQIWFSSSPEEGTEFNVWIPKDFPGKEG